MSNTSDHRPKFDTLFIDPHHYRGDLRLVRTAIRRGWVRPEDRAGLVERLDAATRERAGGPEQSECVRRTLGEAWVWLEMDIDNMRMLERIAKHERPRPRQDGKRLT